MKKLLLFWIALLAFGVSFGQLTGIKSIPGDYATVTAAVADLNTVGVGTGGVTFNIAAGYTEVIAAPISVTATGTATDPIVFQKFGAGANPLITAYTGTATPGSAIQDGIWNLVGSDYVTIDGIDLYDPNTTNPATMEYGYAMFKASATNGCQYNTIQNCVVTLSINNNATGTAPAVHGSRAINIVNSLLTTQTTVVTVTAASGSNSYNRIYGNTLQFCDYGVALIGFADVTPFTFADFGNDIGGNAPATGNTIRNFGGATGATNPVAAIRTLAQYDINVSYNTINNNDGGGVNHPNTLRGIYLNTAVSANATISRNTLTLKGGGTTSQVSAIENVSGSTAAGNTININYNTIANGTYTTATTGVYYCIYNSSSAATVNINNNLISNNTLSGTSTTSYIETGSPTTVNVNNNQIVNNTRDGASGNWYMIKTTSPTNLTVDGNTINNNNWTNVTSTGSIYGFYSTSSAVNVTLTNNVISNLATPTTGTVCGIREWGTTGNKTFQSNQVFNLGCGGGGTIYGLYISAGAQDISKNKIYGLASLTGTAGTVYGIYVSAGTTSNITNNFVSDLRALGSTNTNAINGIYISGVTTANAFYNSIYLNATSSSATTFGTTGIYASTTPTCNLINNIIVNTSTPVGAAYTVAYRRSGTSLTTYGSTSNNNLFYAGAPGANNLIFYDGTNSDQTLAAYQTRVSPRDAMSVTENPPFVNVATTPYDLHMQTTVATMTESGGAPISVTTDYDGDTRNATMPDMGADEFAGIPLFTCALPTPGNTVSSNNNICLGESITLSMQNVTPGTGVTYQWQSSTDGITFSNMAGKTSSTCVVSPATETYYQCVVTCMNGPSTGISTPVHITFANAITGTTPASRCGTGTLSLAATGSAGTTINWYDVSTNALLGTGSPWTTPIISSTTTYNVKAEMISSLFVGRLVPAATTSDYWTNYGLVFSTTQNIVLNSVDVYPSNTTPAAMTIKLLDNTGAQVAGTSDVVFTPISGSGSTAQTVPLNYVVPAGVNYKLVISAGMGLTNKLVQETTGYTYPITTGPVSITSNWNNGSTSSAYYDWFYNWNITTICSSVPVQVVATIGSSPALTLTADQTACNNGIAQIDVTSTLTDYDSYTWTPVTDLFTDAACTTPYVGGASATTVYLKSTTDGSHEIICSANNSGTGCANMDTTHVIVLPSAVTATAANDEFCLTGSTSISITPATGWGDAAFQWMDSPDNVTFSDIVGANSSTLTTAAITDTTYFKLVVEAGASVCTESNVVTLIVKNPEVLSSTPDSRCGVGTLSLEATTTPGTQLYWFDASTGGNLVGTGSPFTTPVISASTTYYAEAAYDNLANITATIGTGTSVSSTNAGTPFTTYYEDGRHQYLILASELTAAGLQAGSVNSISFEIGAVGGPAMSNFNIQMGATSLTALTTTFETGLSSVYSNAAYTFAGTGWQTIALSTPFIWDGTSNVVVQVCFDNSSYSSNTTVYYTTTATNLHHYGFTDGSTGCTMTAPSNNGLDNIRPNMKFDAVTGTYCGSLRTPVVATIGAAPALTITPDSTICNNAVLALNVTSNIPDFDSYVWTPEANLYTDAACTTPYTTGASATTVYIKTTSAGAYEIYCSAINSGTGCTNIDTTTIVVIPGTPVATASPEEICTSGTAAITITPATGWDIATFQWMESTDNVTFSDIVGANAISYTTPVITDTMYYKMVVELGATVCTESNIVTINVKNPQVVSTTPATRCGEGTVTLNATGNTGTELHWYDVAAGGMSLATGTSFTTPSISATTSYWVDASYVDIAPGIAEIGTGVTTGSSGTYSPFDTYWETSKQQILYLASELQAAGLGAGNITSIAFNISSVSTKAMTNFDVSIGTTSLSALTTTFESGLTSVYTSPAYTPAGTGWQTITFTTPFNWDGTSNIVLQVCDGNNTGYATGSGVYYSSTPFVSHHYAYGDDLTGCSSTTFTGNYTSSYRANTRFNGQVVTACTSPRTEVIATVTTPPSITVTATPATICLNETSDIAATSSNAGYTYVWEPGTMSGATQTVTPTGTTTYNVTASDNSGGANDGCVATGSVLVTVNPIPTNVIASASDSSICLGSAFDLSSSATSGADVIINYNEGFEAWPPADWTFINAGTGNNWASSTSFHTGASGMSYSWNSTSPANAWGITGSQSLQAGTQYTISFWYKTGSTYAEKMKVTVGTGATVSDQSTVLWDNAGGTQLLTSTWTQGTVTYTPTVSDDYYFGFNCYSDADMYVLYIDDVSISGSTLNPATYSWTSSPAGYTSAVQNPTGVTPSVNTQYIVTAQNIFGCVASDDVAVTVNPIPVVNLGSDQAICDTTTITLDAGNPGSTYDWSTGGTAQTEDILGSDLGVGANTVTVDVTSAAGCVGTGSVVITVTVCEGIEDPSMQISYYPNPATNMLNLDLSELPTGDYRFELLNMQGQKVMDKILVNDGNVISVNLMDIAPGSYVISVSGNNNTFRNYLSIQE